VQELGGTIARQLAHAGQWKFSIPWTSCLVHEWELGWNPFLNFYFNSFLILIFIFYEFVSSLVQEFILFCEFHKIHEILDFGVLKLLFGDWL